jgi:hypothetical protein
VESLQDYGILVDHKDKSHKLFIKGVYGFFCTLRGCLKKGPGLNISDWAIYERFVNYLKVNGYSFILAQNSTIFDLSIVIYFI